MNIATVNIRFRVRTVAALVAAVLCLLLVDTRSAWAANGDVCSWIGTGVNNNWSTDANWSCFDGIKFTRRKPQNGDALSFSGANSGLQSSNVNDMVGLSVLTVEVTGRGADGQHWNLMGNPLTITRNAQSMFDALRVNATPDVAGFGASFLVPIVLGGDTSASATIVTTAGNAPLVLGNINLNGHNIQFFANSPITVVGSISGSALPTQAGLIKSGQSILTLNDNSFTVNGTIVAQGTLVANNAHAFGTQSVTVNNGATLVIANGVALQSDVLLFQGGLLNVPAGAAATLNGAVGVNQQGTIDVHGTLTIAGQLFAVSDPLLHFSGGGIITLSNGQNQAMSMNVGGSSTLRVGAAGAIANGTIMGIGSSTDSGTLDLNGFNVTLGQLFGSTTSHLLIGTGTLTCNQLAHSTYGGTIAGTGTLVKTGDADFTLGGTQPNTFTGTTIVQAGQLTLAKTAQNATIVGPLQVTGGTVLWPTGGSGDQIKDDVAVTVNAPGQLMFAQPSLTETIGSLAGSGAVVLSSSTLTVGANNASTTFSGTLTGDPPPADGTRQTRLLKVGSGTLTLTGNSNLGQFADVIAGSLIVDGQLTTRAIFVHGGILGGTGTLVAGPSALAFNLITNGGTISPGHSAGVLHAASPNLSSIGTLLIELNGPAPGTGYDQLDTTGNVALGPQAQLQVTRAFAPSRGTRFTIVNVAAGNRVIDTFADLPEGATINVDGQHFQITYQGGDGNDIVLTALDDPTPPPTYYLTDGITDTFFDEDILIANPNSVPAPVTLTFSTSNGSQVVDTRIVPAQSRLTVHVDQIPGLQNTAASAQVRSDRFLPLVVERTMFWDDTHYAGHTGSSVDHPAQDWFFADGAQGFFGTMVNVNNPNPTPTDVTLTFLRESQTPVVKTLTVGATRNLSLDCATVPELRNTSFGIVVHATQPITADRSILFDTDVTGGTNSAGVPAPSTHWFLAEGATGSFFTTFVLLSNPQAKTAAHVTLTYLLDTGDRIQVQKTVPAKGRLTTNVNTENDPRLQNAALSTMVTSDVPVVAERSMYWADFPWREGHNSFGVVDAGLTWGLSEGRTGGPQNYQTFILLANPQTTAANVTVTYLRESGAPIVQTYTVPPTSRFNIDTSFVDGLQEASFGAVIESTNNVPIVVERSMYWDANGVSFSGGTNATAIPLSGVQ
jgi:autotransporter-associated beta strand protein